MKNVNTAHSQPRQQRHFLMKIGVTMFEEETTLSYTLSDNGYIKVYDSLRGKCIDSEVFKRTNKPIIEDLREILKAYFQRMRYFSGLPTYIHSPVFTASAFNNILDDIKQESELVKEKTRDNKTDIIQFLEEQELQPVPSSQPYQWYARCPNAIGFHHLMVSAKANQWGCGYCCKKGNVTDLKNWIKQIEKKGNNKESGAII